MSLATTEALVISTLEGVSGIGSGQVFDRIRTDTDRNAVEAYLKDGGGKINIWEVEVDTETLPDGASRLRRTEPMISIVAHYYHDDTNDSRGDFRDLLQLACEALWDALVSVKPEGARLVERPRLAKLVTGHSAYRARIEIRLWDDLLT